MDCETGSCSGAAVTALFGPLTVERTLFSYNFARSTQGVFSRGGAIYASEGLTVTDSGFDTNEAGFFGENNGAGGAIYAQGNATIRRSTFRSNTAVNGLDTGFATGGAIHHVATAAEGSRLRVWNTHFLFNQARGSGRGGAIYQTQASGATPEFDLRNSTFTSNSAILLDNSGPGAGSDLFLNANTQETLYNSIFASTHQAQSCVKQGQSGSLTGDWNLVHSDSSCDVAGLNLPDVGLGDIKTVGVKTYMPLLAASPAIGNGNPAASDLSDPSTCLPTDFRNTPRPQTPPSAAAARCDIGAEEYRPESIFADRFEQAD